MDKEDRELERDLEEFRKDYANEYLHPDETDEEFWSHEDYD